MVDLRFRLHASWREPPNHGPKDCSVSIRRNLDGCRIGRYYGPLLRLPDITGQSLPIFRLWRGYGLREGFCRGGWKVDRGDGERVRLAGSDQTPRACVEQCAENRAPRGGRSALVRTAQAVAERDDGVWSGQARIPAGDRSGPHRDIAWSSRERCARVISSGRER